MNLSRYPVTLNSTIIFFSNSIPQTLHCTMRKYISNMKGNPSEEISWIERQVLFLPLSTGSWQYDHVLVERLSPCARPIPEEACLSGGLLKCWYEILNERRECLSICIWASREDANEGIHKPAHRMAMKLE
uniref:Uncharacterized protein n=1 Tax=Physcomitrium patens TaxID=3218 RepID=A0A2K1K9Q6_PHYPA|nr:hypothetical protein PHYPA_009688 [Physcomitrium patens]